MDYSKMSDFEINRAVAIAKGFHPDDCDIAKRGESMVGVEWNDDTGYATKAFDYCNNPADAWPIIAENKINIEFEGDVFDGEEEWWSIASWGRTATEHQFHTDDNPLRAAMVVFLMLQESKL